MFKFNFGDNIDEKEETPSSKVTTHVWLKSEQIEPATENDAILKDIISNCEENTFQYKSQVLKYFSTVDILNILRTSDECSLKNNLSVLDADNDHSDLQTAIYEGGLKIWECTYDLLQYIVNNNLNLKNKQTLDLGCGSGLIGILSLVENASFCTFQDYNAEILKYITIPNVILNNDAYLNKSNFYSGDWNSFVDLINHDNEEKKFDYIFTSETIYNIDCYEKLHEVFQKLLKKDGEIYLAAKSYYFGVGGGITSFKEFMEQKKIFQYKTCWTSSDGLKREILKISFS
ncbi:hypothetical protein ABEB36_008667 [Hypothenemus hampei]|uniref:protein-histidine N-methyltransferase n=1 Tax=Hypothenemus hampei TaxID=57062 RepID=A0ABD1EMQ1_HYPHA